MTRNTDHMSIHGSVIRGANQGAFFTQLDWVKTQCNEKLGFEPYPGTLNVRVIKADLPLISLLQRQKGVELLPPYPDYCTGRVLPVSIGRVKGAIIIPEKEVRIHDDNVIEIIAPLKLRDVLNVKDGEMVIISLKFDKDIGVK